MKSKENLKIDNHEYENMIGDLNNIDAYFGSIEYLMATSVMLMFFRSLELL